MFRRTLIASSLLLAAAAQAATVGQPAPGFTVMDTAGKAVNLADFKGKTVVLEWTNPGCPFVQKHYNKSGNLPATQRGAVADDVVWLTVSSTNPQAKDYKKPAELAAWMTEQKAAAKHTLMDDDGKVGKAYAARTTPHLYVINGAGTLVYAGAIDSKPTGNPADIPGATNYVNQALGELKAGKAISQPSTQPYGCSIKYAS